VQLARRLTEPRLLADPPPYRPSPVLRGPRQLPIGLRGVAGPPSPRRELASTGPSRRR